MAKSGVVYDPTSKTSDPTLDLETSGVVWNQIESLGAIRSRPEMYGVVRSRCLPELSGVVRILSNSSRVIRSRLESMSSGIGDVRSHHESSGVDVFWSWCRSESSGVVRSHPESFGVVWSRYLPELESSGVVRSRPVSSGLIRSSVQTAQDDSVWLRTTPILGGSSGIDFPGIGLTIPGVWSESRIRSR